MTILCSLTAAAILAVGTQEASRAGAALTAASVVETCVVDRSRRLCDPDGILPADATARIEQALQAVPQRTHSTHRWACDGHGFQFGVVIVDRINPQRSWWHGHIEGTISFRNGIHFNFDRATSDEMKAFTEGVFNGLGVGHKTCNNGILMAFSIQDRRSYIKTGAGAKRVLQSSHAKAILASLKNQLRAGDYAAAIENAVGQVVEDAVSKPTAAPTFGEYALTAVNWAFFIFLVGFVCHVVQVADGRKARRTDFESKLRRLQHCREAFLKRTALKGASPCAWSEAPCPICLDPLVEPTKVGEGAEEPNGRPPPFTSGPVDGPAEILVCGHVFHTKCIDTWMGPGGSGTNTHSCPLCRHDNARFSDLVDKHKWVSAPAVPVGEAHWIFARDNLTASYADIPAVSLMRADGVAAHTEDDWVVEYEGHAAAVTAEAAGSDW
eukprot:CAMPEP_0182928602 /NCGR_PEP_ID=MMETSP0105_2-20130417/15669_1 /TAXON_ID=81532 ORGANISM="Acanthoeca-like sp., Strain 10tr" /NCGR_SAMPLE_ID=MMETSP0105_2 /ASSEMBLY_ACC=CAM_ASM_000205 /LENGTH=438 /DNA_ID=CAMNT_0025066607 /DNA_START=144 /DNA_END=1457 /DNA_ORIENTATION=-